MKTLILLLTMSYTAQAGQCGAYVPKSLKDIKAITNFLKPRLAPKAVPARLLAPEIRRLSLKYHVNPMLVARVLLVESRGLEGAVSGTSDYGIMQINKVHNLAFFCLMDWRCNLEQGIIILAKRGTRYNGSKVKAYEAKLGAL